MTLTTGESTAVSATALHAATRQAISHAAKDLWPDQQIMLGQECPSVTSYVCRLTVDGEELIAKYSWLGMSLVSILRGAGGTWAQVQEAESAYVHSADLLTAREARNLALLRELGRPRVCETAGFHRGVLLTRAVPGETLADEMTARPGETSALLDSALAALEELQGHQGAKLLRDSEPIDERSVAGVFRRKFNGLSADTYLGTLGQGRGLQEGERLEVVELVRHTVWRLLRMSSGLSPRRDTAVYGDLKPEHVFFDGPRLHFIDPALQWAAGPEPDIAKLAGRSLLLALGHPDRRATQQMVQGIASFLARNTTASVGRQRAERLREVLVLWLMDTVNILTTCLSAPAGLPLAPHQQTLVNQAWPVAALVDRVSALLVGSMAGPRLLDVVLGEVEHRAGSYR
ncbi:hypothetical protein OG372_01630 [Streptomyces sp. NBC_01020]|uniref:hypothetical protein n=1 Tax=Streptomyces sp. NBC_01020 TaxID=2903722 RepID=UPI00386383D6|nr:hypothetical protein OG372_01630 [Streptomyces sp. NBC_01020]